MRRVRCEEGVRRVCVGLVECVEYVEHGMCDACDACRAVWSVCGDCAAGKALDQLVEKRISRGYGVFTLTLS